MKHVFIIATNTSSADTITIIVLIINILALFFVIWQLFIARKALKSTEQSIIAAKIERQLEVLPKFEWVIRVQLYLAGWKEDLKEKQIMIRQSINKKDESIFKLLSENKIKCAKDLHLNSFDYQKMPHWLREIMMSGAKYYYNAIASMAYLWTESDKANYSLAADLEIVCHESETAITLLEDYIKDMVPSVILNTPSSLSDSSFLRE